MSEYVPPVEPEQITVAFRSLRAALVVARVVTEERIEPWVLTRAAYLPDHPWGSL